MKELTLSEKLAALPYEAKVRICFRLLKTAGRLRDARRIEQPVPTFEHRAGLHKSNRQHRV